MAAAAEHFADSDCAPRTQSAEFPNDNAALHAGARWLCWTPCASPRALVQSHAFAAEPLARPTPTRVVVEVSDEIEVEIDVEDFVAQECVEVVEAPIVPDALPLHALVAEAVSAALDDVAAEAASELDIPITLDPLLDAFLDEASVEIAEAAATIAVDDAIATFAAQAVAEVEIVVEAPVAEPSDAFMTFVRAVSRVAQGAGATRAAIAAEQLLTVGRVEVVGLEEAVIEALVANGSVERGQSALTATPLFATTAGAWRAVLNGQSDDLAACGDGALDQWAAGLLAALLAAPADRQNGLRRDLRRQGVAAFGLLDVAA